MAVWIDEAGTIVRPAEGASIEQSPMRDMEIPEGLPERLTRLLVEGLHRVGAVGGDLLLDDVVEELADEGAVPGGIIGDVGDDVAGAGEADDVAFVIGEFGDGIYGLVIVLGAPAADGVEVL